MDLLDYQAFFLFYRFCFFMLKLSLKSSWFGAEELGCSMALLSSYVCACVLNILVCTCPILCVIGVF